MVNDEINEAVSSLVFASARCGELRELLSIRELFGQRYGQPYVTSVLQLLPGNLVNLQVSIISHFLISLYFSFLHYNNSQILETQIKEKLSITSVSEDVKYRLLDEISKESGQRLEVLRLEYTPEIEKQVIFLL